MLHWLHSLLPHVPRYGFVLVFLIVFFNNIGVPLPGKTILLGVGIILGKTAGALWQPMAAGAMACFLGGICCFWLGRRLGHGGLEKIRWLHLTVERQKWPKRFFKRHGPKAVFIARFIPFFPPFVANILAGMAKMPWGVFLFYNFAGAAVWTPTYILIGYLFGKKWKVLEAWLGPATVYLILAGMAVAILGVIFRHYLFRHSARLLSKKRKRTLGLHHKCHQQQQNRTS